FLKKKTLAFLNTRSRFERESSVRQKLARIKFLFHHLKGNPMSTRTLPQVSSLNRHKSPPFSKQRAQYLEDLIPRLKQLPETTRVLLELTPSQSEHIQK